jgi:hypothetical protein
VPLGGDENSIKTCLEQAIDLSFEITETVPALPEIFGSAVYHDFDVSAQSTNGIKLARANS